MMLILPWPPSVNVYWRTVHGRPILSREAREYKAAVGLQCNVTGVQPLAGPVALHIHAYRPQRRGDLDNVLKAALDSLTGYAYLDDAQVVELHAYRHDDKAAPRLEVSIDAR